MSTLAKLFTIVAMIALAACSGDKDAKGGGGDAKPAAGAGKQAAPAVDPGDTSLTAKDVVGSYESPTANNPHKMELREDGTFQLTSADGKSKSGTYGVKDGKIRLVNKVEGQPDRDIIGRVRKDEVQIRIGTVLQTYTRK